MKPEEYSRHQLSAAWGDADPDTFKALVKSIRKRGLIESIVLHDGMVLDGWNRLQACIEAQVTPRFLEFEEGGWAGAGDAVDYVIAANAHRRHMTASQKAACIVRCETLRSRPPKKTGTTAPPVEPDEDQRRDAELAKEADISVSTLRKARAAEKAGLGDQVREGKISAKKAAEIATGRADSGKPTPKQILEGQVANLRALVEQKELRIVELEERVALMEEDASAEGAAKLQTLNNVQAKLRAAHSQVSQLGQKLEEANQRERGYRAAIKRLEKQVADKMND